MDLTSTLTQAHTETLLLTHYFGPNCEVLPLSTCIRSEVYQPCKNPSVYCCIEALHLVLKSIKSVRPPKCYKCLAKSNTIIETDNINTHTEMLKTNYADPKLQAKCKTHTPRSFLCKPSHGWHLDVHRCRLAHVSSTGYAAALLTLKMTHSASFPCPRKAVSRVAFIVMCDSSFFWSSQTVLRSTTFSNVSDLHSDKS